MVDRRIFAWVASTVVATGCGIPKDVGGIANDSDSGEPSTGGDDVDPSVGDGTASAGDDDPGDGPILSCPDNPDACAGMCELGPCGGPLARFDVDGCPRIACDAGQCPEGRTCVALDDWGTCDASWVDCALEGAACTCGGTADCGNGVTFCVPDEEAPPPVDVCVSSIDERSFTFTPALSFEGAGTSTCTVSNVTGESWSMACVGDFEGNFDVAVFASAQLQLSNGEELTVQVWRDSQDGYVNEWLRLTRPTEGDPHPFVAVSADTLLPPGVADADFWPQNVGIDFAEVGCPDVVCNADGPRRGQAIGFGDSVYGPGIGGELPGGFGGWSVFIQVIDARTGTCITDEGGPTPPAWYDFSFVRQD